MREILHGGSVEFKEGVMYGRAEARMDRKNSES